MKVVVSIPGPVFAEAEQLTKLLGTTRSDVYARALGAFVATHASDRLTQTMNEVVDAVGASPDEFVRPAARKVLQRAEW